MLFPVRSWPVFLFLFFSHLNLVCLLAKPNVYTLSTFMHRMVGDSRECLVQQTQETPFLSRLLNWIQLTRVNCMDDRFSASSFSCLSLLPFNSKDVFFRAEEDTKVHVHRRYFLLLVCLKKWNVQNNESQKYMSLAPETFPFFPLFCLFFHFSWKEEIEVWKGSRVQFSNIKGYLTIF